MVTCEGVTQPLKKWISKKTTSFLTGDEYELIRPSMTLPRNTFAQNTDAATAVNFAYGRR
jgi:hypothetical protein